MLINDRIDCCNIISQIKFVWGQLMNNRTKDIDNNYRLLFENNPVMQILINRYTLQVNDANRAARDFFWDMDYNCKGYSMAEILPPDTLNSITKYLENSVELKNKELLITFEKGKVNFNFIIEIGFISSEDDSDLLLVFISANKNLSASKSQPGTKENGIPEYMNLNTFIFQVDKSGQVLTAKGHGLDKINLSSKLLTGSSIFEGLKDYPNVINFVERSINGEYILLSLELSEVVFETVITPIKDVNGHIIGAAGFLADITDRKKTEKALELSEAKYRTLVENTSDIMFSYDSTGIFTYISTSVNRFGYQVDEVVGQNVMDFIYEEDREYVYKEIRNSLSGLKGHVPRVFRIKLKDFSYIVVEEIGKSIMNESGQVVLITGILRDISDRKKNMELTQKIEQNNLLLREAREYDKLKTEFFANISHEFRTPLSVIMATLQLFKLTIKKDCLDCSQTEKFINFFYTIRQNCYRLTRLINNLIDITRIDSNFYAISLQNNNIVKIIENIVLSISEYVENKGLTIDLTKEADEIITACDPDKIERIILNLISNAIKFNSEGGKIKIEISRVNDNIQISVIDTGIGIPPDKLNMIFERFRQIDKSLTRSNEGSGIGLSLVKSLVEMHDGKICVESKYGNGSKFIITLPWKQVTDKESHEVGYDKKREVQIEKIHVEFSDIYMK